MGAVEDLIRRFTRRTPARGGGATAKGMPPAGARVPATGDGKTSTNRKVKIDKPKGGKHR